ncbi:hypothetical protein B0T22DRAFT_284626 [Podospora appendiculata]|uniref:Uncharacterized protein n=1 Tax=Podospora appendiculata TaxID=314037 RepID=A0AAE1C876_9PEZI|nr:hypothetical protein B0T22DRAFT_284626 [Podospora appendiculata]
MVGNGTADAPTLPPPPFPSGREGGGCVGVSFLGGRDGRERGGKQIMGRPELTGFALLVLLLAYCTSCSFCRKEAFFFPVLDTVPLYLAFAPDLRRFWRLLFSSSFSGLLCFAGSVSRRLPNFFPSAPAQHSTACVSGVGEGERGTSRWGSRFEMMLFFFADMMESWIPKEGGRLPIPEYRSVSFR